jgi:hypothetical protein
MDSKTDKEFDFNFDTFSEFNEFIDNLPNMDFDLNLNKNSSNVSPISGCFLKDLFGFDLKECRIDIKRILEFFNHEKLSKMYDSVTSNYKSWTLVLLALFLISKETKKRFSYSVITFIVSLLASHYVHNNVHVKIEEGQNRPNMNVLHLYHHEHDNVLSHVIQVILEFVSSVYVIYIKHIANIFSIPVLNWVDNWIVLFSYVFYTIVHNINYGFFKVNDVHKNHHIHMTKNMGPDICDILFDTKFENEPEQHDHYIPTILFSYFFIGMTRALWKSLSGFRTQVLIVLYSIYLFCIMFLGVCIFYIVYSKNCKEDDKIYDKLNKLLKRWSNNLPLA